MGRGMLAALWAVLLAAPASHVMAQDARIAVAANFSAAAEALGEAFAGETGFTIALSFASTGALYAQITQGAPFDAFLSADAAAPARLPGEGHGEADTVFTYATGRLVLFSAVEGLVTGPESLEGDFNRLAIAEPQSAPYGAAAVEALEALGLLEELAPKLVIGQNIAQTFQFVETGNAELGFVAFSQITGRGEGSHWVVDEALHSPIRQDAILLSENQAAAAFLEFLKSDAGMAIIESCGYAAIR